MLPRHIDIWQMPMDAGWSTLHRRVEQGTDEFRQRVRHCGWSCYQSYVYCTPPHTDGDCRRYGPVKYEWWKP